MKDLSCDIESGQTLAVTDSTGANLVNSHSRTNFPALHQFLEQALSQNQVMGAVVLVAHKGQVILSYVGGWADKENARPMQEDTVFRLGSLSKSVSSWLALCLSEQGLVSLKDRITRYLPNFGPHFESECPPISIHQLLTHTSGLSYRFIDGEDSLYAHAQISDGIDRVDLSWQENFRRVCSVPLRFVPGTGWRYSLGIDVVGKALEVASGKGLAQLLEETISAPLGLKHCSFYERDYYQIAAHYQNYAAGLSRAEGALDLGIGVLRFDESLMSRPSTPVYAGASMLGSGPDLMRILLGLRNGRLLSRSSYQAFLSDHVPHSAKCMWRNWGYTYGAAISRLEPDSTMPMSAGSVQWVGAFGQKWMFDPYQDVIIVSMTNTAPEGLFGAFPDQVRDAVYTDLGLMPG
ncbi:class A beta-lactamase-related serine hydrolase [Alcaligenes faecalis]|uniref:serine hydrolase domain-containing protein n=1 Tax=Alcaligenes faecalis TaxID=511 RepID=UPI001293EB10|nr:serine hydrolase domain-containing protein [Alcaligenes faecalis]MBX6963812.1 class A beta-lactamase-related serine hydrolase [Providencia rettgeri]MBX7030462.1 class A beta-lactamase-related serine hydrolase [Alcaligenes faecalis]QFY78099.1 class A beta-lactamase-related serine hydrolase [Alcaligenes faecalis]